MPSGLEGSTMAIAALFRGKWSQKGHLFSSKAPPTAPLPHHQGEDDDDEEQVNMQAPIRRNSRFYSSMRKKKHAQGHTQDQNSESPTHSPRAPRDSSRTRAAIRAPLTHTQRPPSPPHYGEALPGNKCTREGGASSLLPLETGDWRLRGEMEELSTHMSQACSMQDNDPYTHTHRMVSTHNNTHRMVTSGETARENFSHSLNIVKNIAFLYQEYRDSSEQQEIEQRRQRDALPERGLEAGPGVTTGLGVTGGSGVTAPALQLQLRNSSRSLTLWQNLEAVQESGLLHTLPQREVILQEAMFELVTSEASYYKSLELLESHFLQNPLLINTLSQSDMHFLFSNIADVMKASERFLMDLEHRIEESLLISDVCDIVHHHAIHHFDVFISYVINQVYQEKNYRRILQEKPAFRENMAILENQPKVRGLSFTSFLILPFQRITRLKLLVQNILKKVEENSERERNAIKAHQELERIVKECNEGVKKMSRTEELISIEKTLEFKSKSVPVISHSRWLLKKGEVLQMSGPKSTRTMRSRKLFHPLYLFLFNNLLLITKRSSSGEKFQVLDSCSRSMLRTEDMEDQGQVLAFAFVLKLLENQEDRPISYMLKTNSMSEKLRWICALTPNRRTRFLSASAHTPDSSQVQCIQSYSAQEPDELSVEMADVLLVLEETNDGWTMGERLHDGERGWFPCRVVEDIKSAEIRAQNLRECERIQQAQGGGGASRGRWIPKNTSYTPTWTDQSEQEF
ncbi:ephexin-1 [Neoarius graeffei]|uniref:ephexin-1 n=1 Tax=Neoarius graeffei TaxID=443677 RepID=UPI00298D50DE|nr:ephexin-1 [Neoarius graeffei]XP_060762586.1 ephexin-1 [Neoarius graeffei]